MRKNFSLIGLILLTVFLLAVVWEFVVEELIEEFFAISSETSFFGYRWEEVILVIFFTGTSLIVLTLLLRQREQAQEALQESEEYFRFAFENAPVGMALITPEGIRFKVNQALADFLGYTVEELVDTTMESTAVDLDLLEKSMRLRQRVLDGEITTYSNERNYRHKQGHVVWGEVSGSLFRNEDGEPEHFIAHTVDITERKRAEELLTAAIEEMPEGFDYYDADDCLSVFNKKMTQTYPLIADVFVPGVSYETILRTGLERGQFGPDDNQDEEEWFEERLAYHRDPKGTVEFNLPDGRCIRVEKMLTPEGGTVGVCTDITDLKRIERELRDARDDLEVRVEGRTRELTDEITDRKRMEKALVESEERFRFAFENAPVGMALISPGGKQFKVNKALADFLGYTVEELADTDMKSTAADLDDLGESMRLRQRILDGEITTYRNERRYRHKQGHVVWGEVSGSLFRDENGEPEYFIAHTTDITERKRAEKALHASEQNYRALFENAATGIGRSRITDGKVLLANRQLARIFGYERVEQFIAEFSFVDHYADPGQRERVIALWKKGSDETVEVSFTTRDGSVVTVANQGWVDEKAGHIDFVVTDITDRKETEEQLRQSQKMEAVGQLTGGVAHDFNNLLAVISLNLALVVEASGLDDETREKLDRALAAVDRGANLTDQLLTFSRQQTLNPETIEANTLLFDTINLLMRTLGEDIDIKTAFDTHIPLIKVDPVMLGNAILNMALNARDAMPKGGTLTIKTASSVDLDGQVLYDNQGPLTGPHVLISISDTGTGIKKKYLDRVFEPFFTRKGVGEGSGLGLSMVYGFVKQSGGHVTIDSKRGKGTTVNLYFPAADSLDAEKKEKGATGPKAEAKDRETILVVEDDEDVRQATMYILSRLGYVVLEAEDGPSALETLKILEGRDVSIDLVFSDVIMPSGMSGVDLANKLRRHYQDVKVLMTSGYPEKVIDKYEIDNSGITLLRKPYKMTDLAEAVRGVLDQ